MQEQPLLQKPPSIDIRARHQRCDAAESRPRQLAIPLLIHYMRHLRMHAAVYAVACRPCLCVLSAPLIDQSIAAQKSYRTVKGRSVLRYTPKLLARLTTTQKLVPHVLPIKVRLEF